MNNAIVCSSRPILIIVPFSLRPCCRYSLVPAFTALCRKQLLQWFMDHHNLTLEKYKKVVWSEESRFLVNNFGCRVRIRRFQTQIITPASSIGWIQAGGDAIMRWVSWEAFLGQIMTSHFTRTNLYSSSACGYRCRPCKPNPSFQQCFWKVIDWCSKVIKEGQLTWRLGKCWKKN